MRMLRAMAAAVAVCALGVGSTAATATARPAPDRSKLVSLDRVDARQFTMRVYSAAMNRVITLKVLRPTKLAVPAPTLYLLNGAEDGVGPLDTTTTWLSKTDIAGFTADKRVNVVNVVDGAFSYYTDWIADDRVLGRNKWTTFLTRELPPIVDKTLRTTGRNAIAGVSMSATSTLMLAAAAPALYRSVGSFSGCGITSVEPGRTFVKGVVAVGRANAANMWGDDANRTWAHVDPSTDANLAKLRGINIFVASGNGLGDPFGSLPSTNPLVIAAGGSLEAQVRVCTGVLQQRMAHMGVPATFHLPPYGLHSWPYWQEDIHRAWPGFAKSLGI